MSATKVYPRIGLRDTEGLKVRAARGETAWEPHNQEQALRLLCVATTSKTVDQLTDDERVELTRQALSIDPTLCMSEERRQQWLARKAAENVTQTATRAAERRAADSLRASQETARVRAAETSMLWSSILEKHGLAGDIRANESDPDVLAKHRAALADFVEQSRLGRDE